MIGQVDHEAEYYGISRKGTDLDQEYGESIAKLGEIQDQLQDLNWSYAAVLPGGETIRFPGP